MTEQDIARALERLAEAIGKSTAKWLLKADMPNIRSEMREDIYSEMGFRPVEIVDLMYRNISETARRAKAKAISKRLKK